MPPALALERATLRARVRMGLRTSGARQLLDGVRFASGWQELLALADRFPGSPAFVDPGIPFGELGISSRSQGPAADPFRWFCTERPACPVIVYGTQAAERLRERPTPPSVFTKSLTPGTDDSLTAIGAAALRSTDAAEVQGLWRRVRATAPSPAHGLLEHVLWEALHPYSVECLAKDLRMSVRTLRWRCAAWRMPSPKRLISLARIYHVERMIRWSGRPVTIVAEVLGFSNAANYGRLVRSVLARSRAIVVESGGPEYVAGVILAAVTERDRPKRSPSPSIADFDHSNGKPGASILR